MGGFGKTNARDYRGFGRKRGDEVMLTNKITTVKTYAASNVSTDRTFDADSTSTAELADILGTLIADLKDQGLIK